MDTSSVPLKQCSRKEKCVNPLGSWLPATTEYFGVCRRVKSGLRSYCRECNKSDLRKYHAENHERSREYSKSYYAEHQDVLSVKIRDWRSAHVEHIREYGRKYHIEHKDHIREYGIQYNRIHRSKLNEQKARRYKLNPGKVLEACKRYRDAHLQKCRERERRYRLEHKDELDVKRREYGKTHSAQAVARMRKWALEHPDEHHRLNRASSANRRARKLQAGGTYTRLDLELQLRSQRGKCWHCGKKLKGNKWHADHLIPLAKGGSNAPENIVISCPKCNLSKGAKTTREWNGKLF